MTSPDRLRSSAVAQGAVGDGGIAPPGWIVPTSWIVPQWPAHSRVRALSTTREGGVSRAPYAGFNVGGAVGDDPGAVAQNRTRLRSVLPSEPLWLKQVHGTKVLQASVAMDRAPEGAEADAAVARSAGVVLVIQSADCLPVLLADRDGGVIGVAHAGWRGLCGGVIENVVAAMDVPPQDLVAWLGPAIGPQAYEVGQDVRNAFVAGDAAAAQAFAERGGGKYLADLYALARQRLAAAGVGSVHGGGWCTASEAQRFYSYRRDGVTGRMATLLWLQA